MSIKPFVGGAGICGQQMGLISVSFFTPGIDYWRGCLRKAKSGGKYWTSSVRSGFVLEPIWRRGLGLKWCGRASDSPQTNIDLCWHPWLRDSFAYTAWLNLMEDTVKEEDAGVY